MRATQQAAWRLLPRRFAAAQTIGATSTAVTLPPPGTIICLQPQADMAFVANNVAAAPTAIATDFAMAAGEQLEFKVLAGDKLAAIGAGDLDIFITG